MYIIYIATSNILDSGADPMLGHVWLKPQTHSPNILFKIKHTTISKHFPRVKQLSATHLL